MSRTVSNVPTKSRTLIFTPIHKFHSIFERRVIVNICCCSSTIISFSKHRYSSSNTQYKQNPRIPPATATKRRKRIVTVDEQIEDAIQVLIRGEYCILRRDTITIVIVIYAQRIADASSSNTQRETSERQQHQQYSTRIARRLPFR